VPKKIRIAMSATAGVSKFRIGTCTIIVARCSMFSGDRICSKTSVLSMLHMYSSIMPANMIVSPMRVVMNALNAAFLADSFSNQKPISR
jgi:hypothetical protein